MLITGAYRNKDIILSPDNNYGYLSIPKNASTWTTNYLISGWNWTTNSYINSMSFKTTNDPHIKLLIILRDPIDRWCSGIAQLFWDLSREYDWVTQVENLKRRLFENVRYDGHTDLQCNFLHNIDTEQCIFFYMDNTYEQTFRKFCHINFVGQYYNDLLKRYKNSSVDNNQKSKVKELLRSYCEDPKYNNIIYDFYQKDYELINSVEFYGKTSS